MGDIGSIIGIVSGIIGALSGVASIIKSFQTPKIPKIEIPQEVFSRLRTRIESITPISETARQTVLEALDRFRQGILDPRYKTQLDLAYAQKRAQAQAILAARGLTGSSIEQQVLNELDKWYQQNYYTLLNQQLQDALQLSGLAGEDINAILSELSAYTQAAQAQALAAQLGASAYLGQTLGLQSGIQSLTTGFGGLSGVFQQKPVTQTGTFTSPLTELSFEDLGFRLTK